MDIQEVARQAKSAAIGMAALDGKIKNSALSAIIRALGTHQAEIVAANQQDLAQAEKEGLAAPLLKRLRFDEAKIKEACTGLESLIRLDDPVGVTLGALELDQGLAAHRRHRCDFRIETRRAGADLVPLPEEWQCRAAQRGQ